MGCSESKDQTHPEPKTPEEFTLVEEKDENDSKSNNKTTVSSKMSCIVQTQYGEFKDSIKLLKQVTPKPLDNEVLVRVHAVTLNPADYKLIKGDLENLFSLKFPVIIGHDFAGTVVKIGKNVTKFKVGTRVMGFKSPANDKSGTFAEYIAVDSSTIVEIPSNVSFNEAGTLGMISLVTYQSLFKTCTLKSGGTLVILGGSTSTGLMGIQFAKAIGAKNIIVTTSDGKELCESLGATHTINYKKVDVLETIQKLKLKIDIVYDCVGGTKHWEIGQKVLDSSGNFVTLVGDVTGKYTAGAIASVTMNIMGRKFKSMFGSPNYYPVSGIENNGQDWIEIAKLLQQNKVKAILDPNYKPFSFSLEDVIKMCEIQKKGKLKGKLVMEVVSSSKNENESGKEDITQQEE